MTGWYRDGKCRFLMIIVAIIIVIIINVVVIVIIIITKTATNVRIICFRTDAWDRGSHTVCAEMTNAFLEYTKSMGNDLSTPRWKTVMIEDLATDRTHDDNHDSRPWGFPGLRPGDRWCLCSRRWR